MPDKAGGTVKRIALHNANQMLVETQGLLKAFGRTPRIFSIKLHISERLGMGN